MTLIAALLLLAQDPIDGWIRDLGADEPEARESAQRKLLQAGDEAIPALKRALETTADPEVKVRCEMLIAEIGDTSEVIDLIDPHLVTLERGEYTLAQVAEALSKSGRAVKLEARDPETLVTVGWADAPLMRALDEFCAAHGKLGYSVGKNGAVTVSTGTPISHPVGYAGPVRVDVVRIEETRSSDFGADPKRHMTVTLKLASLNPVDDAWKEVLAVKSIELEDGTALAESKPEDDMGLGGIMGGGAVVRILSGAGQTTDHSFTFEGAPRNAERLGPVRGTVELTMPVGEETVAFGVDDAGKEKRIGDFTVKLESFKRGKAQISFKDEAARKESDDPFGLGGIYFDNMGGSDPRRAEIERRLDIDGIVGVDEAGAERKLETDWKKRSGNGITIVNGQVSGGAPPTIAVEVNESTREIRFTFRARSATRTFPFTIENVPLPE